jgi:serine/threonine protein phosphatase PrpC
MAVESIHAAIDSIAGNVTASLDDLLDVGVQAAGRASRDIATQAQAGGDSADATTLAVSLSVGTEAGGLWCGDSRVYLIREDVVLPMTRDHSWAEAVVYHGLMSADQAARDPRAHMITSWLGAQDPQSPVIETFRIQFPPHAVLLSCSDGLYSYVAPIDGDTDALRLLAAPRREDLQARLDSLVTLALARGGHDDVTGAAIQVLAVDE